MEDLLEQLFSVIWQDIVHRQWIEGLIINIFRKKHNREDPANYRGITLLKVV